MDPFQPLIDQHDAVDKLFQQLGRTQSPEHQWELFEQIRGAIELHAELEEQMVYPRLREQPELAAQIDTSYGDHEGVRALLEQLAQSEPGSEAFRAKMAILQENVAFHVRHEEGEVFRQAQEAMDKGDLDQLARSLQSEEKKLNPQRQAGQDDKNGRAGKAEPGSPSGRQSRATEPGKKPTTRAKAEPKGKAGQDDKQSGQGSRSRQTADKR